MKTGYSNSTIYLIKMQFVVKNILDNLRIEITKLNKKLDFRLNVREQSALIQFVF